MGYTIVLLHSYRCQVSNFHPECIIWELLHAFGSDDKSLVEEASNEVKSQKTEPTERRDRLYYWAYSKAL